jgi:hypothetical protein
VRAGEGSGLEVPLGERPDRIAEKTLFLAQAEIQWSCPYPSAAA